MTDNLENSGTYKESPEAGARRESSKTTLSKTLKRPSRKKRQERLVLILAIVFSVGIAVLAWLTEGRLFTVPWEAMMALEAPGNASRSAAINCQNPKNRNTPYCLNRKAEVKANWEGIQRGGGKGFNLH